MTLPLKPIKNAIANGLRKTKAKCQKKMMKIRKRIQGSSDVEPLFQRGSQIKTQKMEESHTALTSTLSVLRAALLILIPDYSECEDLEDLNGVNADGDKMEEMLTAHDFTVEIHRNAVDIEQVVKDFCKKYTKAETLHFHFSGHGVDNATVEIDPNRYTMNKLGKTFAAMSPAGDSMVGSHGDLYAVHDLTYELMENKPDKVVVTLDCCRNSRGCNKEFVRLKHKRKMSASQQQNIAVIYGTSNLHSASDSNTFTQQLYKVYQKEGLAIPLLEIVRKINKSWKDCGIKQICKDDIVEVGENWKNYMWPSEKNMEDKANINKACNGLKEIDENVEMETSDFDMKALLMQMNDRISKLEDENKMLKSKIEVPDISQTMKGKLNEMSKMPAKVRKMSFRIAQNAF